MNKVIDKGFRSCHFVSTIVKHPVQGDVLLTLHCCNTNTFIARLFVPAIPLADTHAHAIHKKHGVSTCHRALN